jgi:hypothetical protein
MRKYLLSSIRGFIISIPLLPEKGRNEGVKQPAKLKQICLINLTFDRV